jgi:hypothetical protein
MYLPGFAAKLVINGVRFAFSSLDLEEVIDNIRTTNSEGANGLPVGTWLPGTHTSINGNGVFNLTINAPSFDPLVNQYLAPFTLRAGLFVTAQVFLNGAGSVSWFSPSYHILSTGQRIDATGAGSQPSFVRGEANGVWFVPTS